MSEKKLSIIIPMYNSEKFIERTLNSVFDSNLPIEMYDILVVDDGSKDKGPEIVKEMAKAHDNLYLFCQENGGSSKARNTGIDQVNTDFIWFIDSDDIVSKDLTAISDNIKHHVDIDVFVFVFEWCYKIGERQGVGVTHPTVPHDEIIQGRDAILSGYVPSSVCGLIIRRDFLLKNELYLRQTLQK